MPAERRSVRHSPSRIQADIPLLARYFLKSLKSEISPVEELSEDVLPLLET